MLSEPSCQPGVRASFAGSMASGFWVHAHTVEPPVSLYQYSKLGALMPILVESQTPPFTLSMDKCVRLNCANHMQSGGDCGVKYDLMDDKPEKASGGHSIDLTMIVEPPFTVFFERGVRRAATLRSEIDGVTRAAARRRRNAEIAAAA